MGNEGSFLEAEAVYVAVVTPSCAVTVNVTGPFEKSTAAPDAGDTVAFSETVMVGPRAASCASEALKLTVNEMVLPWIEG